MTPKHIISSVRDWLEEGDNRTSFDKLVFNVLSTPAIVSLIERYFPLEDYERDERIAVSYLSCVINSPSSSSSSPSFPSLSLPSLLTVSQLLH